ncbi:MAG: prephenate dehydrogenase [Haloarculaceae archaeon]
MELLVVGAGAMGRWLGRALREDGPPSLQLSVLDVDADAARDAADALDAETVPPDTEETFEAVCFAVPISAAREAIETYGGQAERAVFDVVGVMADPVAAMRRHAPNRERVSFHPLFAPENEPGNVPVVADAPGPATDRVRDALSARDNTLFETTPEEHDTAMETVQARAHTAVLAYALAAESVPERFHTPVSGPLAELAAQVTDGEAYVYADIQDTFEGAGDVAAAARRLAEADREAVADRYDEAGTRDA